MSATVAWTLGSDNMYIIATRYPFKTVPFWFTFWPPFSVLLSVCATMPFYFSASSAQGCPTLAWANEPKIHPALPLKADPFPPFYLSPYELTCTFDLRYIWLPQWGRIRDSPHHTHFLSSFYTLGFLGNHSLYPFTTAIHTLDLSFSLHLHSSATMTFHSCSDHVSACIPTSAKNILVICTQPRNIALVVVCS